MTLQLDTATFKTLIAHSKGKPITIFLVGLCHDSMNAYLKDLVWCIEDFAKTDPEWVDFHYDGALDWVIIDPKQIPSQGASDAMNLALDQYEGEVKTKKVLIVCNIVDSRVLKNVMRISNRRYNHLILIDSNFTTVVRQNSVSPETLSPLFESLPTAWEEIKGLGNSWEVINADPVDHEKILQERSLDLHLRHLSKMAEDAKRGITDALTAQQAWTNLNELLQHKNQQLAAYQNREGYTSIENIWTALETSQQEVWQIWRNLEDREQVVGAMTLLEQARDVPRKVNGKIQEVRESIAVWRNDGRVPYQEIKRIKTTIEEAFRIIQEAEEVIKGTFSCYSGWETLDSTGELHKSLGLYEAALEANNACGTWKDLGWETLLGEWLEILRAQLNLMSLSKQRDDNDSLSDTQADQESIVEELRSFL